MTQDCLLAPIKRGTGAILRSQEKFLSQLLVVFSPSIRVLRRQQQESDAFSVKIEFGIFGANVSAGRESAELSKNSLAGRGKQIVHQ